MKNFVIKLAWFTTIYLVVCVLLAQLKMPFVYLFALCITGQALVVYLVYKVLTDKFTTTLKFKDWYMDHPMREH